MKKLLQARRNIVEFSIPSNNLIDILGKKYSTTQNSVHSYLFQSCSVILKFGIYIYIYYYIVLYTIRLYYIEFYTQ